MNQNKFTILLPYYNRPNMVKFALESLKRQKYNNWELFFCDDGSFYPGEKILDEFFPDYDNVFYTNTKNTVEDKKKNGSNFGYYLNEFILSSDSDICISLCDDDALCDDYLENLNQWYNNNPEKSYSFCDVIPYNPFDVNCLDDIEKNSKSELNSNGQTEVYPENRLDSSQVSWKTTAFRENNVRYPYPKTSSLDAILFKQLYNLFGMCPFNGILGQYKGYHHDQLINKSNPSSRLDKYKINDIAI